MTRTALDLVLRSLLSTCAASALLVMPACGTASTEVGSDGDENSSGCQGGWELPVDLGLDVTGTIVSLTRSGGEFLALTSEGALIRFDGFGSEASETIPATGLRAWVEVGQGDKLVVGDGGQILRASGGSSDWQAIDVGITDDLIDAVAAADGAWALAIASERMLYSGDAGMTWTELPAEAGSWTGLRRVFRAAGRIWLIGDGGQVWKTSDPNGSWEPVGLGASEDLIDGSEPGCATCVLMMSADTIHIGASDEWTSLPVPDSEVFTAVGDQYVVSDRALYLVDLSAGSLVKLQTLDFTPTAVVSEGDDVFVAGSAGELVRVSAFYCLGRPWLVAGKPTTAALPGPEAVQGWARDGLYEHASVASFARFVTELLALAAPPALIQAAQAAIIDELEHARLCFELAARERGRVTPGPLPLDRAITARAGDPVALALALFEEGCIGESLAAAEAGVAAVETEDLDARRALERIAADERQHAALAWRTLRWLIDRFGEPVRAALRRRVVGLRGGGNEVRARVVAELIRPLAAGLLAAPGTDAR